MAIVFRIAHLNCIKSSAPSCLFYTCFSVGKSVNPAISCQKLTRIYPSQQSPDTTLRHTHTHTHDWRGVKGIYYLRRGARIAAEFSMKTENWLRCVGAVAFCTKRGSFIKG